MKAHRLLPVIAVALNGCDLDLGGPILQMGAPGPSGYDLERPIAEYTTVPALPRSLRVGESMRITVIYSPEAARGHQVQYLAHTSALARWKLPDPPCPQNGCADLVGVSPGRADVTIKFCPPGTVPRDYHYCLGGPRHSFTVVADRR